MLKLVEASFRVNHPRLPLRSFLALPLAIWISACVVLNYGVGTAIIGEIPLFGLLTGLASLTIFSSPHLPLRFLIPLILLWAWTAFRFSLGPWTFYAIRDTSAVFGTVWLIGGWFVATGLSSAMFLRLCRWTLVALLTYWCLHPFSEVLIDLSPSTGLHGGSILGSYVNQPLAGPVMVAALVFHEQLGRKFIVIAIPVSAFFCLSAMSRGAIVNAVLGIAWAIGMQRNRSWPRILAIILGLCALVQVLLLCEIETRYGKLNLDLLVGIPFSMIGIETDYRLFGASVGFEQRLGWWQTGIGWLDEHPWGWILGVGYGEPLTDHGAVSAATGVAVETRELHNSWISQLCRGGVVCCGLLVYLYARLFWELICDQRVWRTPSAIFFGSLCIAFTILTISEPGLENPHYAAILWFALGFGLSYQHGAATLQRTLSSPSAPSPTNAKSIPRD